jgi:quercetin dioxygenase-like cupin family protein
MLNESPERFVPDLVGRIDTEDPDSLIVDLATYQMFDADSAVVTLMYTNIASSGLGIVVWNLEPGQENDFHRHPDTEHLHVMLAGEAEYTLADRPPVTVRVGQAVMVPANIPHGIRNTGTQRCSYLAINSPGDYQKVLADRAGVEA